MGIDAGELGGSSRRPQRKGDQVGQPVEESALTLVGIAGLERIVVLVTHGIAHILRRAPRGERRPAARSDRGRSYASQRLRRR